MSSTLQELQEAHQDERDAHQRKQNLLVECRRQGHTLQQIGDVLGLTRAGVLYLLKQQEKR